MRIKNCWLPGRGRMISELSRALALMAGMDCANERVAVKKKSTRSLSGFIRGVRVGKSVLSVPKKIKRARHEKLCGQSALFERIRGFCPPESRTAASLR